MRVVAVMLAFLLPIAAPCGDILIVAPEYPPYASALSGTPSGPMVELIRDMARRAGISDEVAIRPTLRWRHEMKGGDRVTPFLTRTPDREDSFVWIAPAYRDCARFVTVGRHPAVTSLDQGRRLGKVAAVSVGSSRDYLVGHGFANLHNADNDRQTALELVNGRVDAWFGLCANQSLALAKVSDPPVHFGPPILAMDLWIAGSKNLPDDLVARLRAAYAEIKASGQLARYLAVLPPPIP
jgi:polar amino acid transport system substrate-binding protein